MKFVTLLCPYNPLNIVLFCPVLSIRWRRKDLHSKDQIPFATFHYQDFTQTCCKVHKSTTFKLRLPTCLDCRVCFRSTQYVLSGVSFWVRLVEFELDKMQHDLLAWSRSNGI